MPSFDEIQALLEAARERAATEVVTWIPENVDDSISGIVVDLGTIKTKFGDYYTTTIEVFGPCSGLFPEGRVEKSTEYENKLVRVAWMGAVLQSTFMRLRPGADDLVAFHYQKDVPPQNGMNDYALIVAVVIDGDTGKAKVPVDLSVPEVTVEQVVAADPQTGELPPANVTSEPAKSAGKRVGASPLEPRPGETPL
jgi:hypothetical protein